MVILTVGTLAILGACGTQDEGPEPTVTRIPDAANAPVVGSPTTEPAAPTTAPPTAAATALPASPAPSPAASPAGSPVATPGTAEPGPPAEPVALDLIDIAFSPNEITIPANTPVTINLTNKGVTSHNFVIDALNIHSGDILSGATGSVTITAPAGDYEFYCDVPGHKEAGMVGVLHVVEGAAPPATTPAASPAASPVASPVASPTAPAAATPTESTTALTGDVERGKAAAAVCLGCHSVDGSASVGPTWKGLYGSQVELESGEVVTADAAYLHQSIVDPMSQIVKGFPPAMPPFNYLPEEQIADLIAYIESLKE
jgi:cytochrome c oxidase subunit 2